MNSTSRLSCFALCSLVVLAGASAAQASLTFTTGLTLSHTGNLVNNGSFEIGAPPDGTYVPWATNPTLPPLWKSSGPGSSAVWGNDGPSPYRLKASDVLPDGRVGVDFHTVTGVTVDQPPTFNANGQVTFPATPNFTSTAGAPVMLFQKVHTELTPVPSYNLSFWISGEEIATNQGFTGAGLIGLQVTNTLPGDPIQWLAVPNGSLFGLSQVYQYTFTPLNPLAPVDVIFTSWGGMDLGIYKMSSFGVQPILDDVIINAVVPEPATWLPALIAALLIGVAMVVRKARGPDVEPVA